jgi:hypothetical protein
LFGREKTLFHFQERFYPRRFGAMINSLLSKRGVRAIKADYPRLKDIATRAREISHVGSRGGVANNKLFQP